MIEPKFSTPVTTITNKILESFSNAPTIGDLIEEMVNLLGQEVIQQHPEAETLLKERFKEVSWRNGRDVLGEEEQEFYNFSKNFINLSGEISSFALESLKETPLSRGYERISILELTERLADQEKRLESLIGRTEEQLLIMEEAQKKLLSVSLVKTPRPYEVIEKKFDSVTHPQSRVKFGENTSFDGESTWYFENGNVVFSNCNINENFLFSFSFKTSSDNPGIFHGKNRSQLLFQLSWGSFSIVIGNTVLPLKCIKKVNDGRWHKFELAKPSSQEVLIYIDNTLIASVDGKEVNFQNFAERTFGFNRFVGKIKDINVFSIKNIDKHEF